jgi:hypothetical protein
VRRYLKKCSQAKLQIARAILLFAFGYHAIAQLSAQPLSTNGGIDLDGQGKSAIVVRAVSPGNTMLAGRLVSDKFQFTGLPVLDSKYRVATIADLDGDGRSDLIFVDTSQGQVGDVWVWKDFQPTTARILRKINLDWQVQATGDMDGDGKSDIVWRYLGNDPLGIGVSYVWFSNGSANTPIVRKRGGAPLDWTLLGAAQANSGSDAAADITYIAPDNKIRILFATSGRTCANYLVGALPAGVSAIKTGGFRGRGLSDVLIRNPISEEVSLFQVRGNGVPLPPFAGNPDDPNANCTAGSGFFNTEAVAKTDLPPVPFDWEYFATGDFNGDGTTDIVWRKPDNTLVLWLLSPDGSAPRVVDNAGTAPSGFSVVSDSNSKSTSPPTKGPLRVFTVAGGSLLENVPATSTAFSGLDTVMDKAGNLYLYDASRFRIRKVNAATATVQTIAGNGVDSHAGTDGILATSASFGQFSRVAVDSKGDVLVMGGGMIRRISAATGRVTTIAGATQNSSTADGIPALSTTAFGNRLAVDAADNIYISERSRIRRISVGTGLISTIAGGDQTGFAGDGGLATLAKVNDVYSMVFDSAGNMFFAERSNHVVRKIAAGTGIISTVVGVGGTFGFGADLNYSGPVQNAKLSFPTGVAVDRAGNIYVADASMKVRKLTLATGVFSPFVGNGDFSSGGDGGPAALAQLLGPSNLHLDSSENLYIQESSAVRKVTLATSLISTYAGGNDGDGGHAQNATFFDPRALAFDDAGNLHIADAGACKIRKIDARTRLISTVVGTGRCGYNGDSRQATTAQITNVYGLQFDSSQNLVFIDVSNNRVRRVDRVTGAISTIAGNGTRAFSGDNGPATAASIRAFGVAVEANGDLLIADFFNRRMRRVDSRTGIIRTIVGDGTGNVPSSGTGSALSVGMFGPFYIVPLPNGDFYYGDGDTGSGAWWQYFAATGKVNAFWAGSGIFGGGIARGGRVITSEGSALISVSPLTDSIMRISSRQSGPSASVAEGANALDTYLGLISAIASDVAGDIFVAAQSFSQIRMLTSDYPTSATAVSVLLSSIPKPHENQSLTASAVVRGKDLTGRVTFFASSGALCKDVPLIGGVAKCAFDRSELGTDSTIAAEYSGDEANTSSRSTVSIN